MNIKAGDTFQWRRAITEEDVRAFAALSGDQGAHHTRPDALGRLMAHGLLTATLPTKLGGDLNFMARAMQFEFLLPAYSGDTLICDGTVDSLITQSQRYKVRFSFVVANQKGEVLMKGTSAGMIKKVQ